MTAPEPDGIQIPVVWAGVEDVPILFANTFISQFEQTLDAFVVTVGQMTQPALIGTPEEVREQAEQLSFVTVKPVARLAFTLAKMRELLAVLQANVDQLERVANLRPGDPR